MTGFHDTDPEKLLTDAVDAIRAWLAVPAGSSDFHYERPYERAAAAVTLAERHRAASHVLIGNRMREMTGIQVAGLITDPELRARALARELRRAEAYVHEVQNAIGGMVLESAGDRGGKFKIFEWIGGTSRVTLDKWAARVRDAREGGLPAWLQPRDNA